MLCFILVICLSFVFQNSNCTTIDLVKLTNSPDSLSTILWHQLSEWDHLCLAKAFVVRYNEWSQENFKKGLDLILSNTKVGLRGGKLLFEAMQISKYEGETLPLMIINHPSIVLCEEYVALESQLELACKLNFLNIAEILLKRFSAHPDACSALFYASLKGHLKMIRLLLDHSGDINKPFVVIENDGSRTPLQTPLSIALTLKKFRTTFYLIYKGADMNASTAQCFKRHTTEGLSPAGKSLVPSLLMNDMTNGSQPGSSMMRTGYTYDDGMLAHFDPVSHDHPEQAGRLVSIMERLKERGLLEQVLQIPMSVEDINEIPAVHSIVHHETMLKTSRSQ